MQHKPVEITIELDCISIINCSGPDRSISKEDIEKGDMLKSRRYRNRRLGDFLKELDLAEGRSTGFHTIQSKLAENGSPRAVFETTDDSHTFLITIPMSARGVEKNLQRLKEVGIIKRIGSSTYRGYWEITNV